MGSSHLPHCQLVLPYDTNRWADDAVQPDDRADDDYDARRRRASMPMPLLRCQARLLQPRQLQPDDDDDDARVVVPTVAADTLRMPSAARQARIS